MPSPKKEILVARGSRTVKSINHKTEGKISLKKDYQEVYGNRGPPNPYIGSFRIYFPADTLGGRIKNHPV